MELIYPSYPIPLLPLPNVQMVNKKYMITGEMLPIVDENGLVIGQADRAYVHGGSKLLHPVVHLHVMNRMGELYLQKRASSKDLLPGYWDTAVGGHVDFGEYIQEALYREAREELGIEDFNPYYINSYIYESDKDKELVNIFACVGNFDLCPNPDELEGGRFWTFEDIKNNIGKDIFTPNLETEFMRIKKQLESLL